MDACGSTAFGTMDGDDDGDDDGREEDYYPTDDTLSLSTRFVSYPTSDLDFSGEDFIIMFNGPLRVERGVLDDEDGDYDGREEEDHLIDDTLSSYVPLTIMLMERRRVERGVGDVRDVTMRRRRRQSFGLLFTYVSARIKCRVRLLGFRVPFQIMCR